MNLWEFVTVVSIVGILAGVYQTWIKENKAKGVSAEESMNQQKQIDNLEERVKVLEAIVTDSKYDLNQKIDQLKQKESA
ncbi:MAG TPA: hypothetical protein ENJ60_15465 [Aeromonadales bacterium]|nr:hypothetical protein [Aeromonadales bacterium]